jgi:hypothetical protein
MISTCELVILFFISLNQTENGLIPFFLNPTENRVILSHKSERRPSHFTLSLNQTLPKQLWIL